MSDGEPLSLGARPTLPESARGSDAQGDARTFSVDARLQEGSARPARIRCPYCNTPFPAPVPGVPLAACPECGGSFRIENGGLPETVEEVRQFGRFLLLDRVGQGSFGTVWRARDPKLDRIVALKIPHERLLTSPRDVDRCLSEALAAAGLRHPGIVPLHEVVMVGGRPVLVYDFIDGLTLEALLAPPLNRRLTFKDGARLVAEVAEALDYAHSKRLVHRDIKPGNLMVEDSRPSPAASAPADGAGRIGRPVIVDFGLALRQEAEVVMTVDGQVVGTPAYMSPEQAAGKGHEADKRSDVYSLGVVLYELICGELPFRGTKLALLHQVVHEEPRAPRRLNDKIPRDLETVCLKAMAKDPRKRYPGAREFADDLGRFLRGEPVRARPVGPAGRALRWCLRNKAVAGLLALVALSVVAGVVASTALAVREYQQAERADREAEQARSAGEAADAARRQENRQRLLAEWQRDGAEINLAHQDWKDGQLDLMLRRLAAWDSPGQAPRSRGFEWDYLQRLSRLDLATWQGHAGAARALAFSPDGRWLASAGDDRTVAIRDMAERGETVRLAGHERPVLAVAFSPDGRLLASADGGGRQGPRTLPGAVKVWDAKTRRELFALTGHRFGVRAIAFSPDGQRVLCGGGGQEGSGWPAPELLVWDLRKPQEPVAFSGLGRGMILAVAFSPDGRRLAAAGEDQLIRVWDAVFSDDPGPRKPLSTLEGHTAPVLGLAFGPDGRLASAGFDKTVLIWDLGEPRAAATSPLPGIALGAGSLGLRSNGPRFLPLGLYGHTAAAQSVAFSPDGRYVASAGADQVVRIWSARTGEPERVLRGHTRAVGAVAFSPDGWRLASADADGKVKLWDVAGGREPATLADPLCCDPDRTCGTSFILGVALSPDGRWLVTAAHDGAVRVWDLALGRESCTLRGHVKKVNGVAFNPDGRSFASAGEDGTVKVWTLPPDEGNSLTLRGHTKAVCAVAYSPEGRLASAGRDGAVIVWNAATGVKLQAFSHHSGDVRCVSYSPDGSSLASAGTDGTIKVWDPATGNLRNDLRVAGVKTDALAFSPDGRLLASGGNDRQVILWELPSGIRLRTLRGHTDDVLGLAFSPDGQRLVSAGADRTARIWDTRTGQPLLSLEGHKDFVSSVAFSRDGWQVVTGSHDGTAKVWDARPWTPEVAEHWQAVGLLEHLFRSLRSKEELIGRVRTDPTIGETVRERALRLLRP